MREAIVQRLRDRQFIRFLVAGCINTLFGYGVFSLLVLAGLGPDISLLVATVAGVLFNYFTTGKIVFAARGWGRLPWFAAVYSLTFLTNLLSLRGLIAAGMPSLLAQAVLLPVIVVLSFVLNKFLVFRAAP